VPADGEDFRVTLFGDVAVVVLASARRHGVSLATICHVIENAIVVQSPEPADMNVELVIGAGPTGELYEVLVRHGATTPQVFHAMPLRRSIAERWGGR
jgi:threonine dehydrogenase-like Zn-dependent dehydrogenase